MKLRLEQVHDYGAADVVETPEFLPTFSYDGPLPPGTGLVYDFPDRAAKGLAFIDATSGALDPLTPGLNLQANDGPALVLDMNLPLNALGLFALPAFTRLRIRNVSTLAQAVRLFVF